MPISPRFLIFTGDSGDSLVTVLVTTKWLISLTLSAIFRFVTTVTTEKTYIYRGDIFFFRKKKESRALGGFCVGDSGDKLYFIT